MERLAAPGSGRGTFYQIIIFLLMNIEACNGFSFILELHFTKHRVFDG
jgi:hypothetical protein